MRKIAVYGKGGIGKSTISANITAAMSEMGIKVMQIGCDPKHDSTRLLIGGHTQNTVLDYMKDVSISERSLKDVIIEGYKGCLCVEAGGPEPGVGCAGKGIISAFNLLSDLGSNSLPVDVVLYDVLGDVVCGGFAVPLRNDHADTVYIVTSGEFMSIYAANNILKGTANYNPERIGGLIFNSRGIPEEKERVIKFSNAVNIPIVAEFERSELFMTSEKEGKTIVELFPDSDISTTFRNLAIDIQKNRKYTSNYLSEEELEQVVLERKISTKIIPNIDSQKYDNLKSKTLYSSRNVFNNEIIHGCAFSGAATVTNSISGLTTILHSPRSCASFSFQLPANTIRRSNYTNKKCVDNFSEPDIHCTDMTYDSMIFGGIDDLTSLILSQIKQDKRDFALITSCPSGIIGEDVKNVVTSIHKQYPDVRIALLEEDGNSEGDFMQGVIDAGIILAKTFSSNFKNKSGVNLIGVKTVASNCHECVDSVIELLEKIDVPINCVFPGLSDIKNLENIGKGKINLFINSDTFTVELGKFLNDEFGIPCCKNSIRPGIAGTSAWLMEIAKIFDKQNLAENVIKDLIKTYKSEMKDLKDILQGKTYAILSMNKDIDWILETAEEVQMVRKKTCVIDRSDYSNDLDLTTRYSDIELLESTDLDDVVNKVISLNTDIVLAPGPINAKSGTYVSYIPLVPVPGPYSGKALAEEWARCMLAPKEEGWRKDAV